MDLSAQDLATNMHKNVRMPGVHHVQSQAIDSKQFF